MDAIERGWLAGVHYFRSGLTVLGRSPWLYVRLLTLFAIPALIAAIVAGVDFAPGPGRSVVLFFMNGISSTVAPVVIMVAVAAGFSGRDLGVAGSLRTGLGWLPRYLWTNVHTSVIFWLPVGTLLLLRWWQRDAISLGDPAEAAVDAGWFVVIGTVALYVHSRTLLAPFYAIHGDMPATVAALESWRVSGRYFGKVFGTFIVSSAPTAVPLGGGLRRVALDAWRLPARHDARHAPITHLGGAQIHPAVPRYRRVPPAQGSLAGGIQPPSGARRPRDTSRA